MSLTLIDRYVKERRKVKRRKILFVRFGVSASETKKICIPECLLKCDRKIFTLHNCEHQYFDIGLDILGSYALLNWRYYIPKNTFDLIVFWNIPAFPAFLNAKGSVLKAPFENARWSLNKTGILLIVNSLTSINQCRKELGLNPTSLRKILLKMKFEDAVVGLDEYKIVDPTLDFHDCKIIDLIAGLKKRRH
jgi:hypothetical protein